jgi:hypothetical protein
MDMGLYVMQEGNIKMEVMKLNGKLRTVYISLSGYGQVTGSFVM